MSKTKQIRVLIVEDHTIVREGLCALLDAREDMKVVGLAADGVEAVEQALRLKPDVILMDLLMPRKSGVEAISEIKANNPDTRILVLTSFTDDQNVFKAIKAGALGYLVKDSSSQDLLKAIQKVYRGEMSLNHDIALKVVRELGRPTDSPRTADPLTGRELDVLKLIAQGQTNIEIATTLNIVERTVTTHVSNILGKLHLANRTQAALYAIREGITDI